MKKSLLMLPLILGLAFNAAKAQDLLHCGTTEAAEKFLTEHPELREKIKAADDELNAAAQKTTRRMSSSCPIYIIPVVFHVIHNYGSENISDAQIMDEMRVLHDDYRKLNADTTAIVPEFRSLAADVEIEFRLARIDPNGNPTTGIDRIASIRTNNADDKSKLNQWDPKKYLNVWTVKTIGQSGVAGYALYPGSAAFQPQNDGVIILSNYIGSIGTSNPNTSRALTHEIGHYLNLAHVWGNTNQPGVACGDDGVTDTPVTKGFTTCTIGNTAVCTPGVKENIQNYMEYAYCSNMYTLGQKARMRAALNSTTASRSNLWSPGNLSATGTNSGYVPQYTRLKADFNLSKSIICAGSQVTFSDASWRNTAVSWKWSFPGASVTTATTKNPTVSYNTPGVYSATLIAFDTLTSDTTTRTAIVHVLSSTSQQVYPFSEGFESGPLPATWTPYADAPDAVNYAVTTAAAATGTSSLKLNNFSAAATGNIYTLITPALDLTSATSAVLSFKTASASKASVTTNKDVIKISYSFNCGGTWFAVTGGTYAASAFANRVSTGAYTPVAADWAQRSLTLPSLALGKSSVLIRFEYTNGGGGNNLYIDDINLKAATTTSLNEANSNVAIGIYPNPAESLSTMNFSLVRSEKASIRIYDVVGKEVKTIAENQLLAAGDHQFEISLPVKGIYFVKTTIGESSYTNKLIIK